MQALMHAQGHPMPPRMPHPQPIKIYNAVYSSVQVYECMVRGIAVMRRRPDSFVNATQILKVAGIEKGRRTKILEKDILPGKHDIVQGGYGKYQGTWIPLERGRELANQYGVGPLLAPLFDFIPHAMPPFQPAMHPGMQFPGMLPHPQHRFPPGAPLMPGFAPYGPPGVYPHPAYHLPGGPMNQMMPGAPMNMMQQGRKQQQQQQPMYAQQQAPTPPARPPTAPIPPVTFDPHSRSAREAVAVASSLKRSRGSIDDGAASGKSTPPTPKENAVPDQPAPKRARTETGPAIARPPSATNGAASPRTERAHSSTDDPMPVNGSSKGSKLNGSLLNVVPRLATKATPSAQAELPVAALRNSRRAAILSILHKGDDPGSLLELMSVGGEWDVPLDDQGHTALHLAASYARQNCCEALVKAGADVHHGNAAGETPLMRAVLAQANFEQQTFRQLVALLAPSLKTLDHGKRSVLHHTCLVAGVKGRGPAAKYYMEGVFMHIKDAAPKGKLPDFKGLVDMQDEHGDTALNIAARIGNKPLVKMLLEVDANPTLCNKLGLRAADFGIMPDEHDYNRAVDAIRELQVGPPAPLQKSNDVIKDMTAVIQSLQSDFTEELSKKQSNLDKARSTLRTQTRALADARRAQQTEKDRKAELDQVQARIRNLERALREEDDFDWAGRSAAAAAADAMDVDEIVHRSPVDDAMDTDDAEDPEMPPEDDCSPEALLRLRRMRAWHARIEGLVEGRIGALKNAGVEKEYMYRKVVTICTGIPFELVDQQLEQMIAALESDGNLDFVRVSGFMRKVREGEI
ncbi:apses-domain-containing protein [Exidia glandulosa HHB12029]|uniref:Apses-domain-containing protein n=1 Tax=Exidia glandulosa HHB12029 TaxID=1314781 RepID=A0A165JA80_EXIGL|nr:apses-domain-containing protein [Exidia glandulosa HHB12029]